MCGGLQFGGDIAQMSDSAVARARYLNEVYKKIRPLLVQDYHPLTNQPQTPDDGEAVMFVSYDKTSAVLMAFSGIDKAEDSTVQRIHAKGLDARMLYETTNLLADGGAICRMQGDALVDAGLDVQVVKGVALYAINALHSDESALNDSRSKHNPTLPSLR